jgi:GntR family transcriptional regulator
MLEITEHLQITPGTEIVFLQRVRQADNEPISLETAYLPHSICPGIVERFDFNTDSLYKILREEYACPLIWAKQRMQARLPTPVEQKLIGVNQGSPVLSITRITYSNDDHPVELVRSICRGDQYELGIILR